MAFAWDEDETAAAPASRRRGFVRARTESMNRLAKRDLAADAVEYAPEAAALAATMPATWGECQRRALGTASSPCPYMRCAHHLALDAHPRTGSIKANWPDRDELPATCALRVAEDGGRTLEDVAGVLNLTRERVRQLEQRALARLRASGVADALREAVVGACADPAEPWEWGGDARRPR